MLYYIYHWSFKTADKCNHKRSILVLLHWICQSQISPLKFFPISPILIIVGSSILESWWRILLLLIGEIGGRARPIVWDISTSWNLIRQIYCSLLGTSCLNLSFSFCDLIPNKSKKIIHVREKCGKGRFSRRTWQNLLTLLVKDSKFTIYSSSLVSVH